MAGRVGASVIISLKAAVTFQGTFHPDGGVISVTLQPHAGVQLQGTADLSRSRVTASSPGAVFFFFSGHSCAHKHTNYNHVANQLLPISAWGTHHVAPALVSQSHYDLAYTVAIQATKPTMGHHWFPVSPDG